MIKYYCDFCGCENPLRHIIRINRICESGVSYEICGDCYSSIRKFFKDLYMNMKGGITYDKRIS